MADDPDRMRRLRDRFDALEQEQAAEPAVPSPSPRDVSPVQPGRSRGRLRGVLRLAGLLLAIVVTLQLGFTLTSLSGHDIEDARRVGQATVESCERRGPIGLVYGYWDACVVSIRWNDGVPEYGRLEEPHLFRAADVGTTVEIGDNGTSRNGPTYSRETFPPRPVLATLGVILFVVGAIAGLIVLWVLWHLIRGALGRAARSR